MKKTGSFKKAIIAAVTVYVIWGFTFLASSIAQRSATPVILLMYRFDLACLLMLLPVFFGRKKLQLKGKSILYPLLMGLCEPCIYFICEQYGLRYTNSSVSGIFISIIPLFSMGLCAVLLGEKPAKQQWFFAVLSILGVIAISIFNSKAGAVTARGIIWLIFAVLMAGFYTFLNRKSSKESFGVYERTVLTMLEGAVFFTACSVLGNLSELSALIAPLQTPSFIAAIVYLSLFGSVLGYTLHNYALDHAPVANVATLNGIVTILSVLAGVVILKDPFSLKCGIAMAVVLTGIWGVQRFTPESGKKS